MKDNKNKYQFVLVLSQKIEDKDREKVLSKIESWLGDNKAEVVKKEHVGTKELVYEIGGMKKGDFWILDLSSVVPFKLKDFNLLLNREVNVIRYLILKN